MGAVRAERTQLHEPARFNSNRQDGRELSREGRTGRRRNGRGGRERDAGGGVDGCSGR
ncbi:unnamed protein product [Spirodela intermedia]|uniref:Uncharacterized protein n=1 Tax=Spirodela intermedia TaxID=51605 RepID=A0A7I8JRJ6_SPIIN|nr:unnamed protein product [Spirodela intermedia]CAA6672385.1 unnamed protein product [Spirodela intermedia]